MRKVAYYPGCSLESTGKPYDISLRRVFSHLGIELSEIPDWNCCGASSAHTMNERLSLLLPARNLALAEDISDTVLCPCAECYSRLFLTNEAMRSNRDIFSEVNRGIEPLFYGGSLSVVNVVEFLWKEVGSSRIGELVTKPLSGRRLLAYYGCLLTRTPGAQPYDSPEVPMSMEEIIEATGAETQDWPFKMKCCSGSLGLIKESIGLDFVKAILSQAESLGADAIVTACPLCQVNLDFMQLKLKRSGAKMKDIPILYITEVLSVAFGIDLPKKVFSSHFVGVEGFIGG